MSELKILICITLAFFSMGSAKAATTALIKTNAGNISIQLFEKFAPNTVANFIELAKNDYYSDKVFTQAIGDLFIQSGSTAGDKKANVDYCLPSEFNKNIYHQKAGVLSMVRKGADTSGSEFAIYLKKLPHLDGYQSVFAQVTKGLDIVQKISRMPSSGKTPEKPVRIISVGISDTDFKHEILKFPVLAKEEMLKQNSEQLESLFKSIGKSQKLGKLEWFEIDYLKTKCSETQINMVIDFEEARNSKMLVFGTLSNDGFVINQFQFNRGKSSAPHTNSPLYDNEQ